MSEHEFNPYEAPVTLSNEAAVEKRPRQERITVALNVAGVTVTVVLILAAMPHIGYVQWPDTPAHWVRWGLSELHVMLMYGMPFAIALFALYLPSRTSRWLSSIVNLLYLLGYGLFGIGAFMDHGLDPMFRVPIAVAAVFICVVNVRLAALARSMRGGGRRSL